MKAIILVGCFAAFVYATLRLDRFRIEVLMRERGLSYRDAKRAYLREDNMPDGPNLHLGRSWAFAKQEDRQAEFIAAILACILSVVGCLLAGIYL
jgi:hypothetical protein